MNRAQGFTLVEICIVLVIVAMLTAMVSKGSDILEQGRVRNTVQELDKVRAGWLVFAERKRAAFPADESQCQNLLKAMAEAQFIGDANPKILDSPILFYTTTVFGQSGQWFVLKNFPRATFELVNQRYDNGPEPVENATAPDSDGDFLYTTDGAMYVRF